MEFAVGLHQLVSDLAIIVTLILGSNPVPFGARCNLRTMGLSPRSVGSLEFDRGKKKEAILELVATGRLNVARLSP